MSELKSYYDSGINKRRVDVARDVIRIIESGDSIRSIKTLSKSSKRKKRNKRLVLLVATIISIMLLGFTYMYEMNFSDDDGNLWKVIFSSESPKSGELFIEVMTELNINDGDWIQFYANDGSETKAIFSNSITEKSVDIEHLNERLLNFMGHTLDDEVLGVEFSSGEISYTDVDYMKNGDTLMETTPLDEYSYLLERKGGVLEFYCSDETIAIEKLPDSIVKEIASIDFIYGQEYDGIDETLEEHIRFSFWDNVADRMFTTEKLDTHSNETVLIGEREVWFSSREGGTYVYDGMQFVYMEDGIVVEMDVQSDDINKEEAIKLYTELVEGLFDKVD